MRPLRCGARGSELAADARRLVRGRGEIDGELAPAVDRRRHDIWRYAALLEPVVPAESRLSLGEGGTPLTELPNLAGALGLERLLLKREDLNPTGSHKDRGAAYQVSALRSQRPGLRWTVISSSGNAAIAAAAYSREAGLNLAAFVAPGTSEGKLRRILDAGALVLETPKAITVAEATARRLALPNLRPSTDPLAVEGFQTIGWELAEALAPGDPGSARTDLASPQPGSPAAALAIEAVFTFASSGTSFVALGRALGRSSDVAGTAWAPACHVVQGTGAHPIAGRFDARPVTETRGRVGALGARKTRRLGEAVRLVEGSGGSGWVITDHEATEAQRLLRDHGVETSLEGAASVAAARRAARERGLRSAVVLLTGQPRDVAEDETSATDKELHPRLRVVRDYDDAVAVLTQEMSRAPAARRGTVRRSHTVATPDDFAEWAQRRGLSLAFAGTDPHYAIGLEGLVPDYRVVSTSCPPALDLLSERGVATYSPSSDMDAGALRSTAALLDEPEVRQFLTGRPVAGSATRAPEPGGSSVRVPDGLLVFKQSHRIESACRELGLPLLAASAALARRWENKVAFVDLADGLALPTPPAWVVELSGTKYVDIADRLGPRFVLQSPHGFSGSRTCLVTNDDDFGRALERVRAPKARASQLISGIPLTVNACVTARGVACSAPFGQATGLAALTPYVLGSCGNDWSWPIAREVDPAPFIDITRRIGRALSIDGYRGVFGVDFVLGDDGQVYVIEVNARLVASIALHAQLELASGRLPLLARHVMSFLDPAADVASLDSHLEALEGSQVIVHELTGADQVVGGLVRTGAYAVGGDGVGLSFSRPALRVDELQVRGEALVLGPATGSRVGGGASFARLQLRGGVMDPSGRLLGHVADAVKQVRSEAALRPI